MAGYCAYMTQIEDLGLQGCDVCSIKGNVQPADCDNCGEHRTPGCTQHGFEKPCPACYQEAVNGRMGECRGCSLCEGLSEDESREFVQACLKQACPDLDAISEWNGLCGYQP
jgi:hypothetical protein